MRLANFRILLGPFIISWAPIFFMMVQGMNPGSVAAWRFLLGGLSLLIFQILIKQGIPPLNRWMVLGGLAFATDICLWHYAILDVGGGLATVLTNTQVIYMSLLSLKKREFSRPWMVIVAASLGFLGIFLLFYERIATAAGPDGASHLFDRIHGLIFGLVAGMLYTVFLLCFSRAQKFDETTRINKTSALQALTWVSLIGGAGLLLFEAAISGSGLRAWSDLFPSSSNQWIWVIALALVVHVGGWVELGNALNHFRKATMGLILLLQPVMTTAWAWILFDEKMNPLQWLGAASILAALLMIRIAQNQVFKKN